MQRHLRRHRVVSLTATGQDLGGAELTLHRDELQPGIFGPRGWEVTGRLELAVGLPEDTLVSATLPDGRVWSGRGLLVSSQIAAGGASVRTKYRYLGTGPLDGTSDEDWQF